MLLNANVTLDGAKCQLVPYTRECVETYHSWFLEDPTLLESTCSELLSLEEEFENQLSWHTDPSKLTFLIRDRTRNDVLCGDINAFLSTFFPEDYDEEDGSSGLLAELNLMIADKESRRRGIAAEALSLFLKYVEKNIGGVKLFLAKIHTTNANSIHLFEKLGFTKFKEVACFNEVHYVLRLA